MVNYLKKVEPNKKSVCVFTNQKKLQQNLCLRNNGISESGIWKLNMTRMIGVTTVVVYCRHDNINEIIVGDYLGTRDSNIKGRHYIQFKVLFKDQTTNNWKVFCNTGSHPVRYT